MKEELPRTCPREEHEILSRIGTDQVVRAPIGHSQAPVPLNPTLQVNRQRIFLFEETRRQ